jgi:hypothetical protein
MYFDITYTPLSFPNLVAFVNYCQSNYSLDWEQIFRDLNQNSEWKFEIGI